MNTRLVIIGGVAGGATAAARARRLDEKADITLLERGPYVSYANCGLPYFISGEAFGHAGVDKRIDVLATALHGKMTLHDLAELDLAYAPPFSSANDPINLVGFIGENDLSGFAPLITASQLKRELASPSKPLVLDVRTKAEFQKGHLVGARHVPVDDLRGALSSVPTDRRLVVHCRAGFRAHLALRTLKDNGYTDVVNLTGGWVSIEDEGGLSIEKT